MLFCITCKQISSSVHLRAKHNRRDASGRRVVVNFSTTEIDGQENRGAIFLLAESGDTRASEFV